MLKMILSKILSLIFFRFVVLTVNPSMQTVKGKIRIYHPAQNPATGNATKNKIKNQTRLHPALLLPSPAPIFNSNKSGRIR